MANLVDIFSAGYVNLLTYSTDWLCSDVAVRNNAVIWITSNLTITPIPIMYFLKLTESQQQQTFNFQLYFIRLLVTIDWPAK